MRVGRRAACHNRAMPHLCPPVRGARAEGAPRRNRNVRGAAAARRVRRAHVGLIAGSMARSAARRRRRSGGALARSGLLGGGAGGGGLRDLDEAARLDVVDVAVDRDVLGHQRAAADARSLRSGLPRQACGHGDGSFENSPHARAPSGGAGGATSDAYRAAVTLALAGPPRWRRLSCQRAHRPRRRIRRPIRRCSLLACPAAPPPARLVRPWHTATSRPGPARPVPPGPGPATQNPATSTRHCCTGAQRADAQCAATVVCRFAWTRPFSQALPSTARHLSRPASPGTRSLGNTQHVAAHRRIIGSRGLISRSMPRLAYDNQRLIATKGLALPRKLLFGRRAVARLFSSLILMYLK